jgi:hypothetical protein
MQRPMRPIPNASRRADPNRRRSLSTREENHVADVAHRAAEPHLGPGGHHVRRRAAVAEYLAQLGFKNAKNLLGGLDYWAQSVDRAMTRY